MDVNKTKELISRCEVVEQYLVYMPEICPCDYIKISVWKTSEFRYWAQSNLTLHFIETNMYEYPCGRGNTPQEALQAFITDLIDYHEESKKNISDVLFEDFP